MKILFKYPTRERPSKFLNTLKLYRSMLSRKFEYEWIFSCDNDDNSMKNPAIIKMISELPNSKIFFSDNKTKVQAINADMKDAQFDILVLVSDDMLPNMRNFDGIIVENMLKNYPDLDGVLHFNDGNHGEKLNTLSIMGKKYYDRFGYIYHPAYTSLWCDNEFMDVSRSLNKATYIDRVIIKHAWATYVGKDKLFFKNESFFNADKKVFEERKAKGFPK
jgi:hypothetical protein